MTDWPSSTTDTCGPVSSLFEQLDLAAWQHELRVPKGSPGAGRWVRGDGQFHGIMGVLTSDGRYRWAGTPKRGDRVNDSGGNGGWVRGVTPDGWTAVEFDDHRRQVVRPDGTVLHDFYGSDMLAPYETGASDQQANDYASVVAGRSPNPPAQPQDPTPDTEPAAEYGQNSQPVRELRKLFRDGSLQRGEAKPEDQPEQGQQGDTEIVTLDDGSKVVFKSQEPERNDREELSYYVSQALGGKSGLPPIARNPDDPWQLVERVVPGKVAARYIQDHGDPSWEPDDYRWGDIQVDISDTDTGREVGLLDYVTGNTDRNTGNYLVDDEGNPHPIDMGMAQFNGDEPGSPFWDGNDAKYLYSADDVARMETELSKIEPEFRRLGHEDWFVVMMDAVSRLRATEPVFTGQPGDVIELATGLAYLHELRDADGRWTRTPGDKPGKPGTPDRYKVPPHSRLVNPRADIPDPADMPYFKKHPVSVQNIVDAYDQVPAEMKPDGMRWYADAHLLAKAIGNGNAEEGAILLANYSPQANWPINMFRAARVVEMGKPIPKGQGYISGDQVKKAQKALDGGHVDEVLTSPKTRSFAHLIAQGDDSPDDPYGHVVIDAHALNVAEGGTQRGATYKSDKARKSIAKEDLPPIGSDVRAHEYVADQYREAASIIAHRDGIALAPHQLQAVTWVAQVLANMAKDKAEMEGASGGVLGRAKGRLSAKAKDWQTWLAWAKAHNIQLVPGVSALAGQALLAQVIDLVGEDSVIAQVDLVSDAWRHEPRGPDGRWIKKAAGPVGGKEFERAYSEPASVGDLRLGVIGSKVYTTQEFDRVQAEIDQLRREMAEEKKDEARAILTTRLAWIGAGVAAALVLSGVGLPAAAALLIAAVPGVGAEVTNLAVSLGKGRHPAAHPAQHVKAILQQRRPQMSFAQVQVPAQAVGAVTRWLEQTGYTGPDADEIARALVEDWAEHNADRLARAQAVSMAADGSLAVQLLDFAVPSGGIGEQLFDLAFNVAEPRNRKGEWTTGLKPLDPFYNELPESGHRGTVRSKGTFGQAGSGRDREDAARLRAYRRQHPVAPPITAAEARGNSRPVSYDEFQEIAAKGLNQLAALSRPTGTSGLDARWGQVKRDAYAEVRKPWGGATIDTVTGQPLPQGADRFALSVKPAGMSTVSVPENASEAEFSAAMDRALAEFRDELAKGQRHLGVFHDDDNHRIDIDPVLVVDTPGEVESIGAYTHAIGGAYHFKSGDGFWPPHVAEGAQMANDGSDHFDGPGQWRSQADQAQPGLSVAQQAQIADAADDTPED